jgi:hypothetical protein
MISDRIENGWGARGKLRRFGLFLGLAILLYVFAVVLFIVAY